MTDGFLPGVVTIPSALLITAITKAYPMVITTAFDPSTAANTYIPGQLVRLMVPQDYGMFQANNLTGKILAVDGDAITVDLDSRGFDAFVEPIGLAMRPASLAPAGSRNLEYSNSTRQVPFQSLNNRGN